MGTGFRIRSCPTVCSADLGAELAGAFAYDLFKNYKLMTTDNLIVVAVGFITAFVAALIVVRTLLDYVSNRGFTLFAWWRVIVGTLGLIALALGR